MIDAFWIIADSFSGNIKTDLWIAGTRNNDVSLTLLHVHQQTRHGRQAVAEVAHVLFIFFSKIFVNFQMIDQNHS